MKNFFTLLSAIAFFAVNAEAQVVDDKPIQKKEDEMRFQQTPAEFTSDGQLQVWLVTLNEKERDGDPDRGFASLIDEDLNEKKRIEIDGTISLYFMDLNQPYESDFGFYFSQRLFNSDDKYEYIVPITDADDYTIGFKVVSEGTVLQSINFPEGIRSSYRLYPNIIKIGTKLYLEIEDVYDSNRDYYKLLYKIDRAASNMKLVRKDNVGKVQKVYERGRILIKSQDNSLYKTDGVKANQE